jgi:ribosomal-protein-alanine N-acetyltransferase
MNSILQAESYINEVHSIVQDGEAFAWAITSLSTSDFMGEIYLWNIYHIDRRAEVSLELLPEYQNNGLGFEALNTLIEFAFRNLHLHSIEADVDPANDKAISLLEKCGFKREGYFREINFHQGSFHDRAIYSLIDPYTSTIKEL